MIEEYLENPRVRRLVSVTKQMDYTKENPLHLCLKNGHIKVLGALLRYFDCTRAFRATKPKSKP